LTGDLKGAVEQLQASVGGANALLPKEPNNTRWSDFAASAKLELASLLRLSGQPAAANAQADAGCSIAERLLKSDGSIVNWQTLSRSCQIARAENALAAGSAGVALAAASKALRLAQSIRSGDRIADRFAVVGAYRLIGDIQNAAGNRRAATAAWLAGANAIPAGAAEKPEEMNEHAMVFRRLGRTAEYSALAERLGRTGVRTGAAGPQTPGRVS
jgi:hypothetical protein